MHRGAKDPVDIPRAWCEKKIMILKIVINFRDASPSWAAGRWLLGLALVAAPACSSSSNAPAADDAGPALQTAHLTAAVGSTRFVTREHFLAAAEMQISGEPFAEAMGRDLGDYSRDHLPTDIYFDTSPASNGDWIDLPGFSTGVESYEYSKQPMNGVGFELGAGTSLVYAPLVDHDGRTGAPARALLAAKVQHFGAGSNALGRFVFPAGTYPAANARGGNANPLGKGDPATNPLGWPGLWPTTHVFRSFDPTVNPSGTIDLGCAITSDDDPGATGALGSADYECDATTLHLPNRATQIESIISPGTDGFSAWKYGLWVLNYLQVFCTTRPRTRPVSSTVAVRSPRSVRQRRYTQQPDRRRRRQRRRYGRGDVPRLERHRGLPGPDVHRGDRQPRRGLAHAPHDHGRRDALGLRDARRRARLRRDAAAALVPGRRERHRVRRRQRIFPSRVCDHVARQQPARSGRTRTRILGVLCAHRYRKTPTSAARSRRSPTSTAIPFRPTIRKPMAKPTLHDRALGMLRVALINIDRLHTDPATGISSSTTSR